MFSDNCCCIYTVEAHPWERSEVFNELANVNAYLGRYELALQYYLEALKLKESMQDKAGQAKLNNNIGLLHFRMGKYENAISYYEKTLEMVKELNYNLYHYFVLQNKLEKALSYYTRWPELKDTILSVKNHNRIAELEILHQTGQKEAEIALLKQKNARQRLTSILSVVILLLLSGSGLLAWSRFRMCIRLLEKGKLLQEQEYRQKELEIDNERNRSARLKAEQQLQADNY